MGRLDPSIDWDASVTFGFDESSPLRADSFFGFSPSRAQVEYFVKHNFNPQSVANTVARPQTMDELNARIDADVDSIMTNMTGGEVTTTDQQRNTIYSFSYPNSFISCNTVSFVAQTVPLAGKSVPGTEYDKFLASRTVELGQQQKIRDLLKGLFKAQYEKKMIPTGGKTLDEAWFPTELKNLLFVLIPEEDWNKHRADKGLSTQVVLHKKGDASQTYKGTAWMTVESAQFDQNQPVDRPYGGKVRWGVVDPTHSSISVSDMDAEKITKMEALLAQVNKINDNQLQK